MENFLNFFYNLGSFVAIVSVIAFIHEFGHYYVAKHSGVKIDIFAVGFGPEVYGWFDRSGTRWKICWFPLGGYVKMFGDVNEASIPDVQRLEQLSSEDLNKTFHKKSLPIKSAIVAAGPISNFLFAIVILTGFYSYYGKPFSPPIVSYVAPNSAAEKAGIKENDVIVAIDNRNIDQFSDIEVIVSMNPGTSLEFTVKRHDELIKKMITPAIFEKKDVFGNLVKIGRIGITSQETSFRSLNLVEAVLESVKETWNISTLTLSAIGQIITGKRSTDELGGPIRIAKYSGQSAKKGLDVVLWFMAMLSINLGLINLFPIPMLDGGHLLYYAIEAIQGKPLADRFQQYGFRAGMVLIISLMIFSTFNDLKNIKLF